MRAAARGRIAERPQRSAQRGAHACALAVCLAVVLVGCTDGSASSDAPDMGGDESDEGPTDDEVADATEPDEAASDGDDRTGVPAEVVEGPPRLDFGLPAMDLIAPASGGGPRPELAWEPVEGADEYSLTIYREDDVAYWAWTGPETSVRVGRTEDLSVGGPRIEAGMTWTVLAFDADGQVIAQSGERPIAP